MKPYQLKKKTTENLCTYKNKVLELINIKGKLFIMTHTKSRIMFN